ncbi:hypothetical protein [Ottowia testudinis]|uniref:Uncharacterized protein n=1 Tax=Ottowia testudinis TaxID=2816950 RepID=A0A975CJE9_9BURK|nr:hypothetical protein [Ottowia testudinis]QTD45284.1 hypothetical protein J1M35_20095 [Ottowia testudinis]
MKAMSLPRWTTVDYNALSWHDATVYGLGLSQFDPSNGTANLALDIDFIVRWHRIQHRLEFDVAQAKLVFHGVFDLSMQLDYAVMSAGMSAFTLDGIERTAVTRRHGAPSFRWLLRVNWPSGRIEFEADGFTQEALTPPKRLASQTLPAADRIRPVI